jgi:hypothetical protein
MLAAYGVDVLDPAVSLRRVHVLLERLPPAARVQGEHWSTEAELLAHLIDAVQDLTWVTSTAYGGKSPHPKPVKRPPLRARDELPPAGQVPAASAHELAASGAKVKTASWAEAGMLMAGMPGVRVNDG